MNELISSGFLDSDYGESESSEYEEENNDNDKQHSESFQNSEMIFLTQSENETNDSLRNVIVCNVIKDQQGGYNEIAKYHGLHIPILLNNLWLKGSIFAMNVIATCGEIYFSANQWSGSKMLQALLCRADFIFESQPLNQIVKKQCCYLDSISRIDMDSKFLI